MPELAIGSTVGAQAAEGTVLGELDPQDRAPRYFKTAVGQAEPKRVDGALRAGTEIVDVVAVPESRTHVVALLRCVAGSLIAMTGPPVVPQFMGHEINHTVEANESLVDGVSVGATNGIESRDTDGVSIQINPGEEVSHVVTHMALVRIPP